MDGAVRQRDVWLMNGMIPEPVTETDNLGVIESRWRTHKSVVNSGSKLNTKQSHQYAGYQIVQNQFFPQEA